MGTSRSRAVEPTCVASSATPAFKSSELISHGDLQLCRGVLSICVRARLRQPQYWIPRIGPALPSASSTKSTITVCIHFVQRYGRNIVQEVEIIADFSDSRYHWSGCRYPRLPVTVSKPGDWDTPVVTAIAFSNFDQNSAADPSDVEAVGPARSVPFIADSVRCNVVANIASDATSNSIARKRFQGTLLDLFEVTIVVSLEVMTSPYSRNMVILNYCPTSTGTMREGLPALRGAEGHGCRRRSQSHIVDVAASRPVASKDSALVLFQKLRRLWRVCLFCLGTKERWCAAPSISMVVG